MAITRDATFLIPYKNYEINSESDAIGTIVCDYNHDQYINAKDYVYLTKYNIGSNP